MGAIFLLIATFLGLAAVSSAQEASEFLRFPDGVEVHAPGGKLRPEDVTAALARVKAQIAKGQLALGRQVLELVEARAAAPVPEIAEHRERIRQLEFSSVVVLRDGRRIVGRLAGSFRADRLGLESKDEILPDLIRRISVEYHLGWSAVSLTFYPPAAYQSAEVIARSGGISARIEPERDQARFRLILGRLESDKTHHFEIRLRP